MSAENLVKLKVLLKHWIEHNREHGKEFADWADRARAAGAGEAAESILSAAREMDASSESLSRALASLGED